MISAPVAAFWMPSRLAISVCVRGAGPIDLQQDAGLALREIELPELLVVGAGQRAAHRVEHELELLVGALARLAGVRL